LTKNLFAILSVFISSVQGHDFIDSIMFIYYYGKNVRSWKDLGGNIVIIGAGFSIFAQTLTVILVLLRGRRMRKNNAFFPITMNLLVMLFLSNLLFIVGVQSNKNAIRCEMIALLLHYLYLTTSVWCFVFIFIIYDLIINESLRLKMRFILLMAYVGPAIYVMVSDTAINGYRSSPGNSLF
jgi:7 transmembrane receptor (Secretin family)